MCDSFFAPSGTWNKDTRLHTHVMDASLHWGIINELVVRICISFVVGGQFGILQVEPACHVVVMRAEASTSQLLQR